MVNAECPQPKAARCASRARVAKTGAVLLPFQVRGTAPIGFDALVPCGVSRSARPAYDGKNQVRTLAGEPRSDYSGTGSRWRGDRPLDHNPRIAPDAMTVRWNIAMLAHRFHRQGLRAGIAEHLIRCLTDFPLM